MLSYKPYANKYGGLINGKRRFNYAILIFVQNPCMKHISHIKSSHEVNILKRLLCEGGLLEIIGVLSGKPIVNIRFLV